MLLGTALTLAGAPASAQMAAWEKDLYEAAKKEKELTVYTAHYNTEEAASLCAAGPCPDDPLSDQDDRC